MPKTKTSTNKGSSSRRKFKLTPRFLSIVVAIVFVMGIASYGTYRMGRSRGYSFDSKGRVIFDSQNEVWYFGLFVNGCNAPNYGVPDTIKQGDRGGCVSMLQNYLNKFAQVAHRNQEGNVYTTPSGYHLETDGVFGKNTDTEVRFFQHWINVKFQEHNLGVEQGLAEDGVVGPATWKAIYHCTATTGPNYFGCFAF